MDVDSDSELLTQAASGGTLERGVWPDLRTDLLARLDKIARHEFPIPKLPPPKPIVLPETDNEGRLVSPQPSSPPPNSSQEANKENVPEEITSAPAPQPLEPGQLPKQLDDLLAGIVSHLENFHSHPPHTIQRLAELILRPRAHYKALAPYLHAVDRVVMVTSDASIYPLPPPDAVNGQEDDPAASVAWSNPTGGALGSDEALGGALLTPIPWVQTNKPQPEPLGSNVSSSESPTSSPSSSSDPAQGAVQIHSESTEKIEGPNGVGSIETVTVSVNGIPSTGHARGITQGELLRQEQRAGVVPVNQRRSQEQFMTEAERRAVGVGGLPSEEQQQRNRDQDQSELQTKEGGADEDGVDMDEDEETPHARGPEEIGVGDTGPQSSTTSYVGEGGLDAQGIDVEAAVGRKHDEEDTEKHTESETPAEGDATSPTPSDGAGVKREAETMENDAAKKLKEDETPAAEDKATEDADKMEE